MKLSQGLPGVSVVPHQGDDAEQHRRRTKDDLPVQRRLHPKSLILRGGVPRAGSIFLYVVDSSATSWQYPGARFLPG